MKLNNDRIIEIYIKTSYLYWCGLLFAGTLIMLVAIDVIDVTTIALDMGMFVFFALDIVSAACASTKNRFSNKNIKINIIATSIRIAFFVPLVIIGITKNTISSAFGILVFPIIDALYLTLTIKVNSIVKSIGEDNIEEYIKIKGKPKKFNSDKKRKSPTTEPPTRYSLVKDVAKVFANWKNSNNEDCYVYVMSSKHYDGVFILEMSVKEKYWELSFSKNYIDNYDYDFFKKEFDEFIHKIDSDISFSADSIAKEVWEYLKHEFESFDGEVSPVYLERFYKELTIDGTFELSHGEAELYELSVGQSLNKSAIYWCVTWKGGISHADGAGRTVIIDDETTKNLTVESLIEWMKKNLSEIFDLCTPSKYLENEKLRAWCQWWSDYANKKTEQESNQKTVAISLDSDELGADVVEKINQYRDNKSDDTYNALMSVVKNGLFICPFLYDEEKFGNPVSDNAIHFNYDTKKLVESVIDSTSFGNFIEDKEIDGNISFNPTIVTTDGRKLHINNAESYIFSKEASSQTMHYLTAANGGKQFIPLFTDISILKNIYGNAARICIIDYETAMEAAKMEIIDYNGNKANIDAVIINPSRESFVLDVNRGE